MKKVLSILICFCVLASTLVFAQGSVNASDNVEFLHKVLDDGTIEITDYDGFANELAIPETLDNKTVTSIGFQAFRGCSSLKSVTIPSTVTNLGNFAFEKCSSLVTISIPNSVKSLGDGAFSDCTSITKIIIPNSVTSIGFSAFRGCTSLESIKIPDSVTNIGYNPFQGCSELANISVDSGNSVYDSRDNCNAIIFSETNELIAGCKNTTIPNSVTSIDSGAFEDCNTLKSIKISDGVKTISGGAFRGCSSLTEITFGKGIKRIEFYVFDECTSLNKVNLTSVEAWCNVYFSGDGSNPLHYAKKLYLNNKLVESLEIPNGVKNISAHAFEECSSLISVTLPVGFTSIGYCSFKNCTSLTSITMPNTIKSIARGAFEGCNSFNEVNYIGTNEEWEKINIAFPETNQCLFFANIKYNPQQTTNTNNQTDPTIPTNPITIAPSSYTVKIDGVAQTASGDEFTFPVSTAKGFIAYTDGANYYDAGSKVAIDKDLEFTTVAIGEVKMLNGASIRLKEQSGIRFETQVDTTAFASLPGDAVVEKGTLITLKELATDELTLNSTFKTVNVKYLSDEYYKNENVFAGSIVGIKEKNIAKEFIGRGYVKVTVGDITKIIYADYADGDIANNTRSVAFVANAYKTNSADLYNKLDTAHKELVDKWASKNN